MIKRIRQFLVSGKLLGIQLSIGKRLFLGVGFIILLVGVVGVIGIRNILFVSENTNKILRETEEIYAIQELRVSFQQLLMPVNDYLIHGDEIEKKIFSDLLSITENNISKYRAVIHTKEGGEALDEFERSLLDVVSSADRIFRLDDPVINTKGGVMMEEMDAIADQAILDINKENEREKQEIEGNLKDIIKTKAISKNFALILIIAVIFASLIGGFCFTKSITSRLETLVEFSRKVSKGDLSAKNNIESTDEIGELAHSFNQMTEELRNTTTSITNLNQEIERRKQVEGELRKQQQELEISQENLKKFSGRILSIREEEKKSLSTNLHDEAGSLAVALSAGLGVAKAEVKDGNYQEALESIRRANSEFKKVIAKFKKIAINLRPPNLDAIGLPGALREYFEDITKQVDLKINFEINIEEEKLNEDNSIALYRVTQEALNNVIKYAQAKKVKIRLFEKSDMIHFSIQDEGKGFNIEKDMQDAKKIKMGIRGMRERIESLDGTFELESERKQGTKIKIVLPNNQNMGERI